MIPLDSLKTNLGVATVTRGALVLEFYYPTELYTKENAADLVALDWEPVAAAERRRMDAQIKLQEFREQAAAMQKSSRGTRRSKAAQSKAPSPAEAEPSNAELMGELETLLQAKFDATVDEEKQAITQLAKKLAVLCHKTNLEDGGAEVLSGKDKAGRAEWFENNLSRDLLNEGIEAIVVAMHGPKAPNTSGVN